MDLLIPAIERVALTDDRQAVAFTPAGGWRPAPPDLLALLTRLERRNGPARVLAVARAHGPLGVCQHGLLPGHRDDCRPRWQQGEPEPVAVWVLWARLLQDMVTGGPLPPAAVEGWLRQCVLQPVAWGTPPRLAHGAPGLLTVAMIALVTGGPGRRCATCGAVGAGRTPSGRVARVDRGWYCSPACRAEARRRTKRESARRRRARLAQGGHEA
jgi:hypothetical protein